MTESLVLYRSESYDGRPVTGLKHAEIGTQRNGRPVFYLTPSAWAILPQERTPRRARMRTEIVEHSDRFGNVSRFRVIEAMRTESMGPRPTLYGWRAASAIEITP